MKNKGKENTHTTTHPPPPHHHHQDLLLPKPVLWANPDKPKLLGSHSHHLLVAKSFVKDSHAKTMYMRLGNPFVAKGVHFDSQDVPHDTPTLDPYAPIEHATSSSLVVLMN